MTASTINLRPDLDLTLTGLREQLTTERRNTETTDVALGDVEFRLTALSNSVSNIRIGDNEVPATETGLLAWGDFLGVPTAFLKRLKGQDLEATGNLLNALLRGSQASTAAVRLGDGGVTEVGEAGRERFNPVALVDIAGRVLGNDQSPVQRVIRGNDFGFDVHVPFDSDKGVGGDRDSLVEVPESLLTYSWVTHQPVGDDAKVGDVTAAGLRFGQDVKHNLAPWVQPWSMRLACTNGMETTDEGLRVDARGQTIEEVMAEIEAAAERAFSRVERQIEHFYALRDQPVDNPERALRRMARERGIPDRSLGRLENLAPALEAPTRFDLVNLVTNLANSPQMRNDGGRMILERAGGAVVNDESIRCGHCEQKVV